MMHSVPRGLVRKFNRGGGAALSGYRACFVWSACALDVPHLLSRSYLPVGHGCQAAEKPWLARPTLSCLSVPVLPGLHGRFVRAHGARLQVCRAGLLGSWVGLILSTWYHPNRQRSPFMHAFLRVPHGELDP